MCELAEAGGLAGQGLAGRAAQALMLMEYAEEEEALVLELLEDGKAGSVVLAILAPCP